jgi:hypothetical protein
MAIGFWTSGSAAKTWTRNPAGTRKPAAAWDAEIGLGALGTVSPGRGKPSPAAAHEEIIANAGRREYDKVVRFMTCP